MKLKAKRDFHHQGKQHKQGDELELPDHEAKPLIDSGHVEPHPEQGAAQQQQQKPPQH